MDSRLSDSVFPEAIEAAEAIRSSGRWTRLNERVVTLVRCADDADAWYPQGFASLAYQNFSEYGALKKAYDQREADDSPLLAWRARNLLELSVWALYCTQSRENARRFYEDAGRDALNVFDAFLKWGVAKRQDAGWLDLQKQGKTNILKRARTKGIDSLDGAYKRVSRAANECGLGTHFEVSHKLLSKWVHPTALRILGQSDEPRKRLQRDLFFAKGAMYFGGTFETLEEHLNSLA